MAATLLASCGPKGPTTTRGGAVFDISPEILTLRADTTIDLGHLRAGEIVLYKARLRNVGTDPVVITRVDTSCGCTSVEYEKRPIAVGSEGEFSLRFDTRGMWGTQFKLIEIATSAAERPFTLTIMAEVEADNS